MTQLQTSLNFWQCGSEVQGDSQCSSWRQAFSNQLQTLSKTFLRTMTTKRCISATQMDYVLSAELFASIKLICETGIIKHLAFCLQHFFILDLCFFLGKINFVIVISQELIKINWECWTVTRKTGAPWLWEMRFKHKVNQANKILNFQNFFKVLKVNWTAIKAADLNRHSGK